ncbi:thiolase family protein [Pelagicoccus sp. SDUM812005]|uniref:thiolase family protein n=1 Tax=Pelagicoccus sp. SDUM812005 TaxID=3041257 RepID=UPI00280E9050|nr:thiolase family protein [Pelagicoccus sp. SDUM812005]MDQ8179173.1 thiolase family protein [Pelagicoccus sp. SDUM812005]
MKERIAIIDGVRAPFGKAGGILSGFGADDLGAVVVKELLARAELSGEEVDELIFGNVAQPVDAANVARVIALKAGLPKQMPSYTVQRNCASGMESITTAANKIQAGEIGLAICGGTESMSNIPFLYRREMVGIFTQLFRARSLMQKLKALLAFRPRFLAPIVGVQQGLTDPVCGMNMGMTAELLVRDFHITREEQDAFALESHRKACRASENGVFEQETVPLPVYPEYRNVHYKDEGPRGDQSLEALAKLRPYFDRETGTVTVGNACPITDGAVAVLVASESRARELGLNPLGYLRDYCYAGLEGERMGLGPAYASAKLFKKTGMRLRDFDLVELNEAFAAQVIANERAFSSRAFAREYLGRDEALGELDRERLNVNGGSIALGHPVGATGARLVLTLLKELKRRGREKGLATLCVGGGQGAALALEVA